MPERSIKPTIFLLVHLDVARWNSSHEGCLSDDIAVHIAFSCAFCTLFFFKRRGGKIRITDDQTNSMTNVEEESGMKSPLHYSIRGIPFAKGFGIDKMTNPDDVTAFVYMCYSSMTHTSWIVSADADLGISDGANDHQKLTSLLDEVHRKYATCDYTLSMFVRWLEEAIALEDRTVQCYDMVKSFAAYSMQILLKEES
jgi:hypothetical protein